MSKAALLDESDWIQSYILRVPDGSEIPLNSDERPNPKEWTWTNRARKEIDDYYPIAVCGQAITRRFSVSTKSWYDETRAAYVPSSIETKPEKLILRRPPTKKIEERTEESQIVDNAVTCDRIGFSSIENFFQ